LAVRQLLRRLPPLPLRYPSTALPLEAGSYLHLPPKVSPPLRNHGGAQLPGSKFTLCKTLPDHELRFDDSIRRRHDQFFHSVSLLQCTLTYLHCHCYSRLTCSSILSLSLALIVCSRTLGLVLIPSHSLICRFPWYLMYSTQPNDTAI